MSEKNRRSNKGPDPKGIAKECREFMGLIEGNYKPTAPQQDDMWKLMARMITFLEDNGYIDTVEALHDRLIKGLELFANNKCPALAAECKEVCPYAESEDCMIELIEDSYTYIKSLEEKDG